MISRSRAVLALILLLVLAVAGGGAYVVAVVWPARYAKAVLALDAELVSPSFPQAGQKGQDGEDTLAGVLAQIQAQREFLGGIQRKIRALRPAPPRFRELQEDLEGTIAWLAAQPAENERRVRFLAEAKELAALIRQGFPSGVPRSMTINHSSSRATAQSSIAPGSEEMCCSMASFRHIRR